MSRYAKYKLRYGYFLNKSIISFGTHFNFACKSLSTMMSDFDQLVVSYSGVRTLIEWDISFFKDFFFQLVAILNIATKIHPRILGLWGMHTNQNLYQNIVCALNPTPAETCVSAVGLMIYTCLLLITTIFFSDLLLPGGAIFQHTLWLIMVWVTACW